MQCEMTIKYVACPPKQETLYWQALEIVIRLAWKANLSDTSAAGAWKPEKESS
jgi:hypothetical protein